MARVDFFLEKDSGRLYINEINTIPGFTSISMYPKMWEHSGIGFGDAARPADRAGAGSRQDEKSDALHAMMRLTVLCLLAGMAHAQPPPNRYNCRRAASAIRIDGRLDDAAWKRAPWTGAFVDIQGAAQPRPRFRTRVKMLWDDEYFYVAAELEEPHVWATLLQTRFGDLSRQ